MSFKRQPLLDNQTLEVLKEDLEPLWNSGKSASEIADELEFGKYPYHKLRVHSVYYYRKFFKFNKRSKTGIPKGRKRYLVQPKDVVSLSIDQVHERLNKYYPINIGNENINLEDLKWRSYIWLEYWGLLRKSEIYERILSDFEFVDNDKYLKINLPRKKKIEKYTEDYELIPPEIIPYYYPKTLPYLESEVIQYLVKRIQRTQDSSALAFPQITPFTSWYYTKKILGTYPHFQRFLSITSMAKDKNISLQEMKLLTGLDIVTLNKYIFGTEQEALDATDKLIKRFDSEKQ